MSSEISTDDAAVAQALAAAGTDPGLRGAIFEALREAQQGAAAPARFRDEVRWPLVLALLREAGTHRVELDDGLVFEVGPDSRIERALLLSPVAHPDHVWEPQTTRLLTSLAAGAAHIIVGGAYIGDHVLPMARAAGRATPPGIVHAFEPMAHAHARLLRNLGLNEIDNVRAHRLGLWDVSDVALSLEGHLGLASSVPAAEAADPGGEMIESVTIDDYARAAQLGRVGLIMLDTEGGEERALRGAEGLLSRPPGDAPDIVFEIHRHFVDWTEGLENTPIVRLLTARGYAVFAVRDYHDNQPMAGRPIEIIPAGRVYLEGPPHGFNALATKDPELVQRLGLRVVEDVSPKLLLHKDPALHHPIF